MLVLKADIEGDRLRRRACVRYLRWGDDENLAAADAQRGLP
jgi:hypothetical protein